VSVPRARALPALALCLAAACTAAPQSQRIAPTLHAEAASPSARAPKASRRKTGCRASPLANVYHPDRLVVISPCKTVSGVVKSIRREPDGDVHFDLSLDAPYATLVNRGNVLHQHGWLVAEIVPADEPGCTPGTPPKPAIGTYNYGTCTGADETTPRVGTHVSVTGPYVLDATHAWMEIHPVWRIAIVGG
jgi:hypothetical protein